MSEVKKHQKKGHFLRFYHVMTPLSQSDKLIRCHALAEKEEISLQTLAPFLILVFHGFFHLSLKFKNDRSHIFRIQFFGERSATNFSGEVI